MLIGWIPLPFSRESATSTRQPQNGQHNGRKRQRGGGDSTNNDTDNDRARKRSRKEGKAKEDTASQRVPASDEPRRSNRDRNSGDGSNWWQTTAASATAAAGSPAGSAAKTATKSGKTGKAGREKIGKPGRPAKSAVAAEATESAPANKPTKATKAARAEKAAGAADTSTDKPRRGRPRASHSSTEAAAEPPTTNSPAPKKPKKAKTGTAKSPRANKKNRKSGASAAAGSSPTIASPQPRPRAKPQPRQTVEEGEEQEAEDNKEEEADNDDDDDDDLQQPFRQLVPRTRLVPLATMTNKWAPLDRDAIAAVQSLLDECARPVLARLGSSSEKKDRQDIARQAVAGVTRRLRSKLVKGIPFPTDANGGKSKKVAKKQLATMPKAAPATDVSFLSEPTAETHALQSQLTPLQHAVALLASERRREEAALADEYAQLRALETNAQAELRTWRERQRRQHVLADGSHRGHNDARNASGSLAAGVSRATVGPGQDGQAQAAKDNKDSRDSRDETNGLFSDSFDSSAVDLTSLGNHMESVRANLQQIDGVVAAMARSRAALQDVLGERLSGDQYERVLLGR
ncbi:hypothetical protein F503_03901 [Ophiostoma piceae UAMH 11346]|uniref:Kinetochore protein fta7 n=1 Tax=Ophiostoma piceae (strain UAMH 11346) TaxID=1262450 RepID=S3C0T1_OPHP1|nr:hypothetical protein F503_03901 [Ophiostoma piceae UAMH 11346]